MSSFPAMSIPRMFMVSVSSELFAKRPEMFIRLSESVSIQSGMVMLSSSMSISRAAVPSMLMVISATASKETYSMLSTSSGRVIVPKSTSVSVVSGSSMVTEGAPWFCGMVPKSSSVLLALGAEKYISSTLTVCEKFMFSVSM